MKIESDEETVRIWPVIPTEIPNDSPISISRRPIIIDGDAAVNPEMIREGSSKLRDLK